MGEDDAWWRRTQELLQPALPDGPALTEKHLKKPPWRFVHDIFTALGRRTGFGEGLLKSDELDAKQISQKSEKIAVLTKMIDFVGNVHRTRLAVKASEILAGKEPQKTNEFLQSMALGVRADKTDWLHALGACGVEAPSGLAAEVRDRKEKKVGGLSINPSFPSAEENEEHDEHLEQSESPKDWDQIIARARSLQIKIQDQTGIDLKELRTKGGGARGMQKMQEEVQEAMGRLAKEEASGPPEQLNAQSILDDPDELVRQIEAQREKLKETIELTNENKQMVDTLARAIKSQIDS